MSEACLLIPSARAKPGGSLDASRRRSLQPAAVGDDRLRLCGRQVGDYSEQQRSQGGRWTAVSATEVVGCRDVTVRSRGEHQRWRGRTIEAARSLWPEAALGFPLTGA